MIKFDKACKMVYKKINRIHEGTKYFDGDGTEK